MTTLTIDEALVLIAERRSDLRREALDIRTTPPKRLSNRIAALLMDAIRYGEGGFTESERANLTEVLRLTNGPEANAQVWDRIVRAERALLAERAAFYGLTLTEYIHDCLALAFPWEAQGCGPNEA